MLATHLTYSRKLSHVSRAYLTYKVEVEKATNVDTSFNKIVESLSGSRIVDIAFFFQQMKEMNNHEPFAWNFKHME